MRAFILPRTIILWRIYSPPVSGLPFSAIFAGEGALATWMIISASASMRVTSCGIWVRHCSRYAIVGRVWDRPCDLGWLIFLPHYSIVFSEACGLRDCAFDEIESQVDIV